MKGKKHLKKGLKHILGNTKSVKPQLGKGVTILLAGTLGGSSFESLKTLIQPADLAVGILRDTLVDKDKTVSVAKKTGFDLILGENVGAELECQLHKIKGIGIGVLTFDGETGTTKDLRSKISALRKDGADFVVVYMNSGSKREVAVAKKIAAAGADYIFGYGKKKTGPYTVLPAKGGKSVPVICNSGNLMRNQGEVILVELQIKKGRNGKAVLGGEGYYPCVTDGKIAYLGKALKTENMEARIGFEEALFRIKGSMGVQSRMHCYVETNPGLATLMEGNRTAAQLEYEVQPTLVARKKQLSQKDDNKGYVYNAASQRYERERDEAEREALLVCTGHVEYGGQLEEDAESFGSYEFMKSFRKAATCFADADFVMGGFATMASEEYPSIGEVSLKTRKTGYSNCRKEFVTALKKVGFTGLSAANMYNACMGIEGIFDTEDAIKANGMIPCGIGHEKNPVVEINGIKIGFVSATTSCLHNNTVLTEAASSEFLHLFDGLKTKKEIAEVKAKGAEFVLAYLHCGMNKRLLSLEDRKAAAQSFAEIGADYVICTGSREVSPYYRYETEDGRSVPIATSLGCFLTGRKKDDGLEGAVLKIAIRRDFDGKLYVDDKYTAVQIFDEYEGAQHVIVPVENSQTVAVALGDEIQRSSNRIIAVDEKYTRTLTIAEIYQILEKTPSEKDLEKFGEKYHQPISCVSIRRKYLRENGVAVMYKFGDFGATHPIEWDIQRCVDAGISLVIANEYYEELPCIVVEEPLMDVFEKLSKTARDWYDPVTVAITGSMGKTTAKELTTKVFESNFKTLCASGNNNAIYQIGHLLQSMEEDDEAYIQEVHGGTLGTAACVSRVIQPDICIVTNIVKNHISQIGSVENLVANKLAVVEGMKPGGVLILCDDNEYLKEARTDVRTIRYSIEHTDAHYYAQNIQDEGEFVRFEIVSTDSEFDTAGVYPAVIYTRGVHNVSNALAAYAAGRQAGIPPYKIIAGLSRYRTTGIRQNAFVHNGIKMILDTYNSNPKALLAMFDVLNQIKPDAGGRKILVLGMMGEQGDESPQIHYDTGKAICQHDFDIAFCYGEDAKYLAEAVKECGREAYYFEDRAVFNRVIADTVRPGDVVMVKGSHSMELDSETMVPIFGRTIRQY